MRRWPHMSISQAAAARKGPNGMGVARWCWRTTISATPTTAPTTAAMRIVGEQHLPAEPRAERGEELEVTVPHAFLTGE